MKASYTLVSFNCYPSFSTDYAEDNREYTMFMFIIWLVIELIYIKDRSYGCWNEEQIKVVVIHAYTHSCMVIEICSYGLNGWAWVCYLLRSVSTFSAALWFYEHSVPNTFAHTCTFCLGAVHFTSYQLCMTYNTHIPCMLLFRINIMACICEHMSKLKLAT